MFSGIVEHIGSVVHAEATPHTHGGPTPAHRLELQLGHLVDGLRPGASVAVNGVCLTITGANGAVGHFDVIPETWQRSTLSQLRPGDAVNLERSLQVGDRIDGHFVQGHVDGVGTVARVDQTGGQWKLWINAEPDVLRYVTVKGSIALDGTSLTIVDRTDSSLSVALIPTTLDQTVLGRRRPGDRVNIETDILARIVAHQLQQSSLPASTITWQRLQEGGFA